MAMMPPTQAQDDGFDEDPTTGRIVKRTPGFNGNAPPSKSLLPASKLPPPTQNPAALGAGADPAPVPDQPATPAPTDPLATQRDTLTAAQVEYNAAKENPAYSVAPQLEQAIYHAPKPTRAIIAGLASILFPGSGIASMATSYAQGGVDAAKEKYDQEQTRDKNSYEAQVEAQREAAQRVSQSLTRVDVADRSYTSAENNANVVAERATAAADRAQLKRDEDNQHAKQFMATQALAWKKRDDRVESIAARLGFDKTKLAATSARLMRKDAQDLFLGIRRGNISEETAMLRGNITMQVAMLNEGGRNSRYNQTAEFNKAKESSKQIDAVLTSQMRSIGSDATLTPEQKQQKIGELVKGAHDSLSAVLTPLVAKHAEFGALQSLDTAPSDLMDGQPQTGMYPSGGGGGNGGSGYDPASLVRAMAEYERAQQGGASGVNAGAPNGPPGGYKYNWQADPMNGGAPANTSAAPPHVAGGMPEADFSAVMDDLKTHAAAFPSEQALSQFMASNPKSKELSPAQHAELMATWRTAHGGAASPVGSDGHGASSNGVDAATALPPVAQSPAHDAARNLASAMMRPDAYGQMPKPQTVEAEVIKKLMGEFHLSAQSASSVAGDAMKHAHDPAHEKQSTLETSVRHATHSGQSGVSEVERQQSALHPNFTPEQAHAAAMNISTGGRYSKMPKNVQAAIDAGAGLSEKGQVVNAVAKQVGIDPLLLAVLIQHESNGNQNATSPVGARGMSQFMPGTAAGMGIDPSDPLQGIAGGAVYLHGLLKQFGSIPIALAAYNAGPNAVSKYRGIPPFKETRDYVNGIMADYLKFKKQGATNIAQAP